MENSDQVLYMMLKRITRGFIETVCSADQHSQPEINTVINATNELTLRRVRGSYVNCCQVSQHTHEITSRQPRLPAILRVLMETKLVFLCLRELKDKVFCKLWWACGLS
jgi:hypothetical protein